MHEKRGNTISPLLEEKALNTARTLPIESERGRGDAKQGGKERRDFTLSSYHKTLIIIKREERKKNALARSEEASSEERERKKPFIWRKGGKGGGRLCVD